jgi:hypothetical protein
MIKSNIVVFIVANEGVNAGERDYMKALAAEIGVRGARKDTKYLTYKILPKETGSLNLAPGGDPAVLPLNDAQYAAVPFVGSEIFDRIEDAAHVSIVGVGHSTLGTVLALQQAARQ